MDIVSSNTPQNKLCYTCGLRPRKPGISYCRDCYCARRKGYNKQNYDSEKQRDRNLRAHFNLTQEEYDLMFFRQCGLCAICGQAETKVHPWTKKIWPLCVDHNHETGQVRELLCFRCNALLGRIERDRSLVKKFEKYLRKHDM